MTPPACTVKNRNDGIDENVHVTIDQRSLVPTRHLVVLYFNDSATTEIYTLSLHDAVPISRGVLVIVQDGRDDVDNGIDIDVDELPRGLTRLDNFAVQNTDNGV